MMNVALKTKGLIMVMVSAVLYGLMPLLARFSYSEGVNVVSVLFYRYFFAFILLSVYLLIARINLRINLRQLAVLSVAAIAGTVFTTYSLFLSYSYISTGLASALHFVYPAVTCLLAFIIYKEHFRAKKILALVLSIAGIVLLSVNGDMSANMEGILWALASGVFYAIYIICSASKELKGANPYKLAFYVFGISCISFLFIGMFSDSINVDLSLKAVFYLGNLSFLSTFLAVVLFFIGVQNIGPSDAAILSTLEPITGVVLGLIVFNETMNSMMLAGCVCVMFSVWLIAKSKTAKVHAKVKRPKRIF